MGACTEPGNLCIITEYMPKGDVYSVVHDPNCNISLQQVLAMAVDCASGMTWLHQSIPPIIHRDLKPTNLLVDEHFTVKICDFGLSAFLIEDRVKIDKTAPGTPLWMSPEVLCGEVVTEKVDVYAFGIVLWEMITAQDPFSHHRDYHAFVEAIVGGERPPIPDSIHPELSILMQECWQAEPTCRPSFTSLIPRLNNIIVATAIKDPRGSALWRHNWNSMSSVPWLVFVSVFYSFLGEPLPHDKEKNIKYRCLQAILATQPAEGRLEVTMERFGHLLGWFGPLDRGFLDTLRKIMAEDWFHGDVSKAESESVLMGWKKRGSYLVRVSLTDPYGSPFTLSMLNNNKTVEHQRIGMAKNGVYWTLVKIKGQTHRIEEYNIDELIKRAVKHLDLRAPVLGSKYRSIFGSMCDIGGGYVGM
eukprot:TRINITY_DN3999_c0_g1_i4.p1 TRINITY_DN3999_c0_g1~~TRINITY_DN3999_c0_g1_i4.p1  ORF type:complete len:416 (-),score=42.13 TRINITY_DN3999_c0_g1_i4:33-1280(-)